jgi:hypothetical protein
MKHIALVCLSLGLLVSGCGEQLTNEAQKAVEQIKVEASKAAAKTMDDIKTDVVTRLGKVLGVTVKKDQPQEKTIKNEDALVQK